MSTQRQVGERVEPLNLTTIAGDSMVVPAREGWTHLQFRRFAGCPVCSVHLRSMTKRRADIEAAHIHEVLFFHSSREALLEYHRDLPFAAIADPARQHYRAFGVERSVAGLLHPRTALAALRGLRPSNLLASVSPAEDHAGLPADFLLDAKGILRAVKYGTHPADQWSVDELLAMVRRFEHTTV